MKKRNRPVMPKAKIIAIYLYEAARAKGDLQRLRGLIRDAHETAVYMYGLPDEKPEAIFEESDSFGINDTLSEFAAAWDEYEREFHPPELERTGTGE